MSLATTTVGTGAEGPGKERREVLESESAAGRSATPSSAVYIVGLVIVSALVFGVQEHQNTQFNIRVAPTTS